MADTCMCLSMCLPPGRVPFFKQIPVAGRVGLWKQLLAIHGVVASYLCKLQECIITCSCSGRGGSVPAAAAALGLLLCVGPRGTGHAAVPGAWALGTHR